MHTGLTRETVLSTLPSVLRRDASAYALADALAQLLAGRVGEVDLLRIYPDIDRLDEGLLDILAYDFKVDWWNQDYSLDEKLQTMKNNWRVHRMLGTKKAVELAVSNVFGEGKVLEWFEYGGSPGHFKVSGIAPDKIEGRYDAFMSLLGVVKRQSAVLDSITINLSAEHRLYTGFAVRIGRHVTVDCEIPTALDVIYMTDENGDILADENGNRIID